VRVLRPTRRPSVWAYLSGDPYPCPLIRPLIVL